MQDVQLLIDETKESLIEYLPKLANACQEVANLIQETQDSWLQLFEALLEGVEWVSNATAGIQKIVPEAFESTHHERLQQILQEMYTALSQQDMVLLPDLLLYELNPVLNELLERVKR